MSNSISCNFARCAVRHLLGQQMKRARLQKGVTPDIVRVYNLHFENTQQLQVTYKLALNRFPAICIIFNKKWSPQENENFSYNIQLRSLDALPQKDKETHTLMKCQACIEKFTALISAFPLATRRCKVTKRVPTKPLIELSVHDLSSSQKNIGRKILKKLNTLSQDQFQTSAEEVIMMTPKSRLVRKSTPEENRKIKRKIEKNMRDAIMQQKEEEASGLVLKNRVSWSTYNKLRKAEGLATLRKRPAENDANGEPSSKRRYGNLSTTLQIDTQNYLQKHKRGLLKNK